MSERHEKSVGTAVRNLFSRVLVGVDDSQASKVATLLAARLAREYGGELLLCHSVNWLPVVAEAEAGDGIIDAQPLIDSLKQHGEALVTQAAEGGELCELTPRRLVLEGEPVRSLLRIAAQTKCSLIVMGTHGRGNLGRFFLGSTTAGLLRASAIPVLTVRAESNLPNEMSPCFRRLVVATDDSEPSRAALETALELPEQDRRKLFLCTVADSDGTRAQALHTVKLAVDSARTKNLSSEGLVAEGNVGNRLVAVAKEQRADILVVGSHGRRGMQRLFVGSVAEDVVRKSSVPVLVVRTLAVAADGADFRHRSAIANPTPLYASTFPGVVGAEA